mmetsp:Transcript_3436/g.9878  ORF Transcript_3436/g.9878 Transcript_3436/m.9878 type:complete len:237 (+) Transcript_3436:2102-2812(+)
MLRSTLNSLHSHRAESASSRGRASHASPPPGSCSGSTRETSGCRILGSKHSSSCARSSTGGGAVPPQAYAWLLAAPVMAPGVSISMASPASSSSRTSSAVCSSPGKRAARGSTPRSARNAMHAWTPVAAPPCAPPRCSARARGLASSRLPSSPAAEAAEPPGLSSGSHLNTCWDSARPRTRRSQTGTAVPRRLGQRVHRRGVDMKAANSEGKEAVAGGPAEYAWRYRCARVDRSRS